MRRGLFDSREPLTPSETLVDRIVNEPRTKKAFIRERLSPTYQMAKRDLSKLGAASILILVFVGFAVFASLSFSKEDAETSRRFCSAGIFGAVVLALGGTQMEKPYAYFRELWFVGNCLRKNRTPVLRDAKDYRRLRPRVFDAIRGRIVDMVEVVELLRAREEKKDDKSGLLADMIEEDLALQLFALAQPFEILGNVRFN